MKINFITSLSLSVVLCGCSAMLPYRDSFKCEKGKDGGVCNSVIEVYELSDNMDNLRLKASTPQDKENTMLEKENNKGQVSASVFENSKEKKELYEIANSISIKQIQDGRPIIFNINELSLVGYDYEIPNNQQVLDYLIKDDNAYTKRLRDEKDMHLIGGDLDTKSSNSSYSKKTINHLESSNSEVIASKNSTSKDSANTIKNDKKIENNDLKSFFSPSMYSNMNKDETFNGASDTLASQDLKCAECQSSNISILPINANVKVCVYSANIRQNPSCNANILRVAKRGEVLYALYSQGGWVKLSDGTFIHRSIVKLINKEN